MLEAVDLGYRYPSSTDPCIGPLNLQIKPGTLTVLAGPTGSGKSTLLRLLAGLTQRHGQGQVLGAATFAGRSLAALSAVERASTVAYVSQCPEDQIICRTVVDELCFGLENAGADPDSIEPIAMKWMNRVGLDFSPDHDTAAMSGGEQQRLVTAGAIAAGAQLLLLDEPLAQLDPAGAAALVEILRSLASDGYTVVVAEHRLSPLWNDADEVIILADGHVQARAAPDQVDLQLLRETGLSIPPLIDFIDRLGERDAIFGGPVTGSKPKAGNPIATIPASVISHDGMTRPALQIGPLTFARGERVALIGKNGSGKSTLLNHIRGHLSVPAILVPQNSDLTLFNETVDDELAFGPLEQRLPREEVEQRVDHMCNAIGLLPQRCAAPHSLSAGQRVRLAVGAALCCDPTVLLLDEPTSGQDARHLETMMAAIDEVMSGQAIIISTHNMALALRFSSRVLVLDEGRLVFDGPPESALPHLPHPDRWVDFCHDHHLPILTPAEAIEALRA